MPDEILAALIFLSILLIIFLTVRPSVTTMRAGKILAFLALFALPLLCVVMGFSEHVERSKQTQFCLSCHIMGPYGESLNVDDPGYLAAGHFQNHRIPADQACYTCHTDYTIYGGIRSKIRGLRHAYAQYVGTPASPIRLYSAYNNRECLHCHDGARSFEEGATHNADPELLPAVKANARSCMTAGCHDIVHNIAELRGAKFWERSP